MLCVEANIELNEKDEFRIRAFAENQDHVGEYFDSSQVATLTLGPNVMLVAFAPVSAEQNKLLGNIFINSNEPVHLNILPTDVSQRKDSMLEHLLYRYYEAFASLTNRSMEYKVKAFQGIFEDIEKAESTLPEFFTEIFKMRARIIMDEGKVIPEMLEEQRQELKLDFRFYMRMLMQNPPEYLYYTYKYILSLHAEMFCMEVEERSVYNVNIHFSDNVRKDFQSIHKGLVREIRDCGGSSEDEIEAIYDAVESMYEIMEEILL